MWIIEHFFLVAAIVVPICASAAVTIHVLLTKQDTGSATTWIGLAWLTPYAGALLYVLFGINRVARRARKLRRRMRHAAATEHTHGLVSEAANLRALNVASLRVTGRRAVAGNTIRLLSQGDESYPAMLAAIEGARTSLVLSSYIFRNDTIGRRFIAALADAARRGVQVRVLIDGIGGGYIFSPAYRHLRALGVPAARFMHSLLPWRMPFLNLRSHRKLLIADGRAAFTGGLNISDENVLATNPSHPVRDTHFAVSGPVVSELMTAFVEDWAFATGEWLSGPAWFPPIEEQGNTGARVITSGPDHDLEKVKHVILAAVASSERTVRIATPYFLPDAPLVTTLALAAMRSVTVDIVIPGNSDHMLFDFAARAGLEPLIQAGCRIWHGTAPFDHSKLMTVDGSWSLIGSANWDMRSMRLNFELNVEAYDPALASQLDERIASRHGYRVRMPDLNARSLPAKLRDAALRLLLPYL